MNETTSPVAAPESSALVAEAPAPKTGNPAKPRPQPRGKTPSQDAKSNPKAPVAKKPSAKKSEVKPTKAPKAKAEPKTNEAGDRRRKVVQYLRKVGADKATTAVGLEKIAKGIGMDRKDVYVAISGGSGKAGSNPNCLMATNHAKAAQHEDGLAFYLTAKGKSTDFAEAPFVKVPKATKKSK